MKRLVPYLLLTFMLTSCATSTTKTVGVYTGEPQTASGYSDEIKQGRVLLYNRAGEPYFEGNIENGQMEGMCYEYAFFSGEKELITRYECQRDHCKGYSPDDNTLINEVTFYKGLVHGQANYYYPTGEHRTAVNFVRGQRQGEQREYYKNGQLKKTTTFINDQMDGPQRSYTPTGLLQSHSIIKPLGEHYVHLQTKEYNEHGTLQHETITDNRGTINYRRSYSVTGRLIKELDYQNKTTIIYDDEGKIVTQTIWKK